MGIEILAPEPVKDVLEVDKLENMNPNQEKTMDELVGIDGPSKGDVNHLTNTILPKDAVDEWPVPKQIHSFYFVKIRSYENPKLKAKLDQADKEIQKRNQERFQIIEALKAKRLDRAQVISQLKPLSSEGRQCREMVDVKRKELEPLQSALGKLRNSSNTSREKGVCLCSSEEELNDLIKSLHYRIQHESNTLAEEKQLVREIKQLEGTREKVVANAAIMAKLQESLGEKEAIQDQVKLIGVDLDGVRKEQQLIRSKIKLLEEELKDIDTDIATLQEELQEADQKKNKALETFNELRKGREDGNAPYYQNRTLLNNAKDLAAKKDVAALEELSHNEVEKFMALWCSDKTFRLDYETRILASLDIRQLSRDGRMRNPDEKTLIPEPTITPEPQTTTTKSNKKLPREESKLPVQPEPVTITKVSKVESSKPETELQTKKIENIKSRHEDTYDAPMPSKDVPKTNEIDEAKLKEIKREEEIAKSKLALERKKKLAEKAAAKAAARALKEAEKKLKEREKKAKKKAGVSAPANEFQQVEDEVQESEPEKVEEKVEPLATSKKEQKEKIRPQKTRPKRKESIPKIVIKKKRSNSYWLWALSASLLALVVAVLSYYYMH